MCFFFFNDTATTEIYTLSLHDALPILYRRELPASPRSPFFIDDYQFWKKGRSRPSTYDARCLVDRPPSELQSSRWRRSEEHTSELQSQSNLVCRLLLEKKKRTRYKIAD